MTGRNVGGEIWNVLRDACGTALDAVRHEANLRLASREIIEQALVLSGGRSSGSRVTCLP